MLSEVRCGVSRMKSYQFPVYFDTQGHRWYSKPWSVGSTIPTIRDFSPTARGRAEAIYEYLRLLEKDAGGHVLLDLRDGRGKVEALCFRARHSDYEKWYWVNVREHHSVSGLHYVRPVDLQGQTIIVEATTPLPSYDEFASEYVRRANGVPPEQWLTWAKNARRSPFTEREKEQIIARSLERWWWEVSFYEHKAREHLYNVLRALELIVIIDTIGDQAAFDCVSSTD